LADILASYSSLPSLDWESPPHWCKIGIQTHLGAKEVGMNSEALETRLTDLENEVASLGRIKSQVSRLKGQLKRQREQIQRFQDVEEIERLQKAYGYYLEHWMSQEVIDCFAEGEGVELRLYEGTWLGKDGVKRYFTRHEKADPESLHQVMQLSGVVTPDSGGKTARGRWYSFGAVAAPIGGGIRQFYMNGIYECVYLKQDGKWKIQKLHYSLSYSATPGGGWVGPERVAAVDPKAQMNPPLFDQPPADFDTKYPSGYIFPFHFVHPVTGQKTTEDSRNASLKLRPNRFARSAQKPG
jgi:hypothetical protein